MDRGDKFLKIVEMFCYQNAHGNWPDFWDAGGVLGIYKRALTIPKDQLPEDEVAAADEFIKFILHENPRLYPPERYPQPAWFPDAVLIWRKAGADE